MPSFKTAGKSKEDLALVAQLSGLLTAEESAQLTRVELVRILEKENRKSEKTSRSLAQTINLAGESITGDTIEPASDSLASDDRAAAEPVKKARSPRTRKTAAPETDLVQAAAKDLPIFELPAEPAPAAAESPKSRGKKSIKPVKKTVQTEIEIPAEPNEPAIADAEPIIEAAEPVSPAQPIPITAEPVKAAKEKRSRKTPSKTAVLAKASEPEQPTVPGPEPLPDLVQPTAISETAAPVVEKATVVEPAAALAPETPASEKTQPGIKRQVGRRRKTTEEPAAVQPEPVAAEIPNASAEIAEVPAEPVKRRSRTKGKAAEQQAAIVETSEPAAAAEVTETAKAVEPAAAIEVPAEPATEMSPEASEAASDADQPAASADLHRVPAHHTLRPNRPGPQRRTTRIIGEPQAATPAAQPENTEIPAVQNQPVRQPGRRYPNTRGTAAASAPANTYPVSEEQQQVFLADAGAQAAAPATSGQPAEQAPATIVPLIPSTESEIAKPHRPFVETGDIQAGVLEIMPDGYGFLRKENYLQGNKDIYVPPQYIRRFGLRPGDFVTGPVKLQRESDRYQALLYIKDVNGMPPEKMLRRPHFDKLTPIYPDERFVLETVRNELSTRIIDLVAPIGKGQRGMIVSPPKAGKTILLQKIANAISVNNPDVKLIVLLIDERPEEVTDMQRSINGEVVYSTFDKTPENHTKVTELVLERAMRLVELKQDVVILLDSMTRLARAYNLTINPTGRTLSGGLDPGALYGPKRFFGAARNIENGGSLTIIATSLIETGSRMDEVIFEEFKGTGNMEVYLDRKMSEKRIFPAIDINKSGTRREELLMTTKELDAVWTIRKAFSQLDTTAVTEAIINLLLKTKNNEHFISSVNVSFNDKNVFEAMRGVRPQDSNTNQPQRERNEGREPRGNFNPNYGGGYRRQQQSQQSQDDD